MTTQRTFKRGDRVYITATGYHGPSIDVITDIRPASSGAWLYVVGSGAWLTAHEIEHNDLSFPEEEFFDGEFNLPPVYSIRSEVK